MSGECPQCHGKSVIAGKMDNQIDYVNPPVYFRPDRVPLYAIVKSSVSLPNSFSACTFCGFLWSKVDSQKLQRFTAGKEGV